MGDEKIKKNVKKMSFEFDTRPPFVPFLVEKDKVPTPRCDLRYYRLVSLHFTINIIQSINFSSVEFKEENLPSNEYRPHDCREQGDTRPPVLEVRPNPVHTLLAVVAPDDLPI